MNQDTCLKVGKVLKAHGLKGQVRISLDMDVPIDFEILESFYLLIGSKMIPFFIDDLSIDGNKAYIKFEDVDDLNAAEAIQNVDIYVPKDLLDEEDADFYRPSDLIGFTVIDVQKGTLGAVNDVLQLPGQDVIVMHYREKEVLIPVNDELIQDLNFDNKTITYQLPEGLLEIYLEN